MGPDRNADSLIGWGDIETTFKPTPESQLGQIFGIDSLGMGLI